MIAVSSCLSPSVMLLQVQAPANKSLSWSVNPTVLCPSEQAPFLCTASNNCGAQ